MDSNMESKTDRELVDLYRAGSEDAATELYLRYGGSMISVVRQKLSPVKDRGHFDSNGIAHSGFKSFFRAVRRPDFDSAQWKIVALLSTIVQRKCAKALRRKRMNRATGQEERGELVEMVAAAIESGTEQEVAAEWEELAAAIMETRTELERRILALYIDPQDERTQEEIARDCECSLTKVLQIIKEFEAEIRRQLRELEDE